MTPLCEIKGAAKVGQISMVDQQREIAKIPAKYVIVEEICFKGPKDRVRCNRKYVITEYVINEVCL